MVRVRGLIKDRARGWGLGPAARTLAARAAPDALSHRLAASPRCRVLRLMWETSPALTIVMGGYVLADGFLPILALVALGLAVGRIPQAVAHGLGSPSGHSLLIGLAIGTAAYALSLLRSPAEALLSAHCSAVMSTGMQRRLARAVCAPAGIEHLEDSAILDQLASASGELSTSRPADAPMALASAFGDRLSGFIACVVLASFRWYIGLLFLVGWSVLRPPLRRRLAERATLVRRATAELRHSWYYLGCSYRPEFAKEVRVFGLGRWILGRYRDKFLTGMEPSWRQMRHFRNRALLSAVAVAAMYTAGAGILALAAWHRDVGLATVAVMLPMLPTTMQVGGVSAADVGLEQMLAAVPDLDDLIRRLRPGPQGAGPSPEEDGRAGAAGLPGASIRFDSVTYRYPGGSGAVCQGLDLELPAGRSLALVGANGAGKTTLVTLLARLREPSAGRITVDGIDLRDLDTRSWQRQVAVVNQDFGRYPLSARENVAFCDLTGEGLSDDFDEAALERAAAQAGALDFVGALPHGWDTICAPGYRRGTDLSGGQWQRIALARALYAAARGARVLILDEPTAHLDVRAEASFYTRFLELTSGLTTMVISHRFATVRRADQIAVLDQGRITELGRHEDLVAAGGSYAEMFAMQAARFAEAEPDTPEGRSRG
ncbi:MAG TPA: ABC transporter ATP-binding protein [Streptosporangiaceae bacterium]|nr:ABC transporter ATP-binding protein [Streptosporangiaceae bacterium]